jgi:NADH dehydrogenase (ubiquinone) 1 alpha subcomplex subunit 5
MLPTFRVLAEAGTQRLVPFSTTGITGILTHPNPRPALIAIYNHTLTLLSRLPEHSVYRRSTENLTRHRLAIVESVKPEGWEAFQTELKSGKEYHGVQNIKDTAFDLRVIGKQFQAVAGMVSTQSPVVREFLQKEVDRWRVGREPTAAEVGVTGDSVPISGLGEDGGQNIVELDPSATVQEVPLLPEEPPLFAEQVVELEEKLGGGLIEEIIDQGWEELTLIKEMEDAKIWDPLEVQPEEGQWVGFERTS